MACRIFLRCRSNEMLKLWGAPTNEQMVVWDANERTWNNPCAIDWKNQWSNETMNQWANEWMNQWSDEGTKQWIKESVSQLSNEATNSASMNQWSNEAMKQWINEARKQGMNDPRNQRKNEFNDSVNQPISNSMNQRVNKSVNRPINESMHLLKVFRTWQWFNILKCKSSFRFSPVRFFCRQLSQIGQHLRKQRPYPGDPRSHFTWKNKGFRARERFHPWIHTLPNCYTSQLITWWCVVDMVDMMMWLTWWCAWHDGGNANHI